MGPLVLVYNAPDARPILALSAKKQPINKVNSEKPITTLHVLWGREAVSRYKMGMVDNIVRLAHSVYDFFHPAIAEAFVFGIREARAPDDWLIITNALDIKKLGMPLRARLIEAARKGDVQAIRALVATGIKIESTDENGLNALHHAAKEGKADVVAALVDAGAEVDARTTNGMGQTPLHLACESPAPGTAAAVHVLIESKADANAKDNQGNTPLHSLLAGSDINEGSADLKASTLLKLGGADPRNENKAGHRAGETMGLAWATSKGLFGFIMDIVVDQQAAIEGEEASRFASMKRMGPQFAPGSKSDRS